MKIITIEDDEKFLRQISKPVDLTNENYKDQIKIVKEICANFDYCFAMATVQIGIPYRMIYIKNRNENLKQKDDNPFVLINPEILSQEGLTEYYEACMSCITKTGLVQRPYSIKVKYFDENGLEKIEVFNDFLCTIISHEIDHLNGILHMDRSLKLYDVTHKDRPKWREIKKLGYKVISKNCEYIDCLNKIK